MEARIEQIDLTATLKRIDRAFDALGARVDTRLRRVRLGARIELNRALSRAELRHSWSNRRWCNFLTFGHPGAPDPTAWPFTEAS